MNAERDAFKRAQMANGDEEQESAAPRFLQEGEDFGHQAAESQLDAIGTMQYQERADFEVEGLNDWERQHLGVGDGITGELALVVP